MAAAPKFKVYRDGEYVAACKYAEDAAMLVAGATGIVKYGHKLVIWREGAEQISAGESYDEAAAIMVARVDAARNARDAYPLQVELPPGANG